MARYIFFALSCACLLNCSALLAQPGLSESVLPLKLYGQHLIVVQGSIGTLERRNLVIDTGAYPSIIDSAVAKKLHLAGRDEDLDSVDRTLTRAAVIVPSFDVGPIHVAAVRSLVNDLSAASRTFGLRIDALIGLDVLAHSSFRLFRMELVTAYFSVQTSFRQKRMSICHGSWVTITFRSRRLKKSAFCFPKRSKMAGSFFLSMIPPVLLPALNPHLKDFVLSIKKY